MSIHATRPGASEPINPAPYFPVDRAIPRAGDPRRYAGDESTVKEVRETAAPVISRDPDRAQLDPIVAVETRRATVPIVATIRRGFEWDTEANRGNRRPAPLNVVASAPQQAMEREQLVRANTLRVTPTAWDAELLIGRARQ